MTRRVQYTPAAREDLIQTSEYIARDKLSAAGRWLKRIEAAARMLAQHPLAGQSAEQYQSGLRMFTVRRYVIFYRVVSSGIEVVRVLNGARDLDSEVGKDTDQ